MGWPRGIEVDATTGTSTALNIEDSSLRLRNITFAGNAVQYKILAELQGQPLLTMQHLPAWFTNPLL